MCWARWCWGYRTTWGRWHGDDRRSGYASSPGEEEQQRQRLETKRQEHLQVLRQDLSQMVDGWSRARQFRKFAEQAEQALGELMATPEIAAYLGWVKEEADRIDPLCHPQDIPKHLCIEQDR